MSLLILAPSTSVRADDLSQLLTSTLEIESDKLMAAGNVGKAVPYLHELARRFRDTEDPKLRNKLELYLYYLGVGYLQNDSLSDAGETFEDYADLFPDGKFLRNALQFQGDCFRRQEQFDQAIKAYEQLRNRFKLDGRATLGVVTKLADCYIGEKQWEKVVSLLKYIGAQTDESALRGKVFLALMRAYLELDRMPEFRKLLPDLLRSESAGRYDLAFNLALIETGDNLLTQERNEEARLLYKLALSKEDLLQYLDQQERRLARQRDEEIGALANAGSVERIIALNERLATIRTERKSLAQIESYSEDLRLRLAQSYHKLGRAWDAYWTYWSLWKDFPGTPIAGNGLYGAFSTALQADMPDRALLLGDAYVKDFPEGENFDEVSQSLGQLYIQREDYATAVDFYRAVLESHPRHQYFDAMAFNLGYALFQLEDFDESLKVFSGLRRSLTDSGIRELCDYWLGLTYLFRQEYTVAKQEFSEFVLRYDNDNYVEDAAFRVGICHYGLLEFEEARERMEDFILRYPASSLRSEAFIVLGDIAAAEGRTSDAMQAYESVENYTTNMVHINYASFQIGKLQELRKDYTNMAAYFERYLMKWGSKGNYSEAIWRVGFAKKQMGDYKGALDHYLKAIKSFGNDPTAIGIDLVLEEWPQDFRSFYRKEPSEILVEEQAKARIKKERTYALRLEMALSRYNKTAPVMGTYGVEDIAFASPAVLNWMAEYAATNVLLARKAYERVLGEYGRTEWCETALVQLAELEATDKHYDKATALFRQVQERFASSPSAGVAKKREADLLRDQREYARAIDIYQDILTVRDWNDLWAECLFQIGNCHENMGNLRQAFPFYQRVYVLYQSYSKWVARAYLHSGICLEKLNQRKDAVQTYQEMIGVEKLKNTPEYAQARQRLSDLL